MIDTFSILLSHALVFVACWRLLRRPDLDDERQSVAPPTTQDKPSDDA